MSQIIGIFEKMDITTIISLVALLGAAVSGIGLLIIKKRRKDSNEDEEKYQKDLAKEYREEWLKRQQMEESKDDTP